MKINAVPLFTLLALAGFSSQLSAEERADELERIAPIGKVSVAGQEQPASAAEPAAEAAAAEMPAAESAPQAATETAAAETPSSAAASDGQLALATTSGCMACHKVDAKLVGPGYQEVAAKYKGDAAALEMLVEKVKKGGTGTWGPVPMPPNAHVSDENIRAILAWVLSL